MPSSPPPQALDRLQSSPMSFPAASGRAMNRDDRPFPRAALALALLLTGLIGSPGHASTGSQVQERIDSDTAAGKPVVVHVVVALCDNAHQTIVPVPAALGNGRDPEENLYWGAKFGVRTHLPRVGWTPVKAPRPADKRVLDRIVLRADLKRDGRLVPAYVIADAWDGAHIRASLDAYLRMAGGDLPETIEFHHRGEMVVLRAGGAAHLLAYLGHNGLMEFSLSSPACLAGCPPRSAVVLACSSKAYFLEHLTAAGAHPLLLTTGFMAPEAYTLDSAIRAWVERRSASDVIQAAAEAYDRYQNCGLKAARRLFWGLP